MTYRKSVIVGGQVLVLWALLWSIVPAHCLAETLATCGAGWLERVDGQLVLHVKGTPYEMGYQHGALLKQHCTENLNFMLHEKAKSLVEIGDLKINPRPIIDSVAQLQREYTPDKFYEEMRGLADASGLAMDDIVAGNFIPELFHCSGFAVMNSATTDGVLYHGRVLDYACDWRLQEHAVVIVAEPKGGIPFVNVTYAGFIGSVTGMNARHVSIGEMGGRGLGHWEGVPMAFLVREVLETADDVSNAVNVFAKNPRTCVYYYVVADGKTNEAVGLSASWKELEIVRPGETHELLPHAVPDAVLLSAGTRYEELVSRTRAAHGRLDENSARQLMDRPVAMRSNLHNVLFAPASTRFWVAHASPDGTPAAEQPYHAFQLTDLLAREPESDARALPGPELAGARQAAQEPLAR